MHGNWSLNTYLIYGCIYEIEMRHASNSLQRRNCVRIQLMALTYGCVSNFTNGVFTLEDSDTASAEKVTMVVN